MSPSIDRDDDRSGDREEKRPSDWNLSGIYSLKTISKQVKNRNFNKFKNNKYDKKGKY
jgi:hypothetical protein